MTISIRLKSNAFSLIPTKETIKLYVNKIIKDKSRYDFLIINCQGKIVGESVINEVDTDNMSACFRIGIFDRKNFGRGIGTEAIKMTLKFGFEELNLHRIELEVFSFNERGYRAYKRVGFEEEGIKRKAVFIEGKYHDIIVMGILRDEFLKSMEGAELK
ncbi:MAG: GNAT family N-acetyltransferase [Saccharofermentanales bacterium]